MYGYGQSNTEYNGRAGTAGKWKMDLTGPSEPPHRTGSDTISFVVIS
jgi:hypothetical protein